MNQLNLILKKKLYYTFMKWKWEKWIFLYEEQNRFFNIWNKIEFVSYFFSICARLKTPKDLILILFFFTIICRVKFTLIYLFKKLMKIKLLASHCTQVKWIEPTYIYIQSVFYMSMSKSDLLILFWCILLLQAWWIYVISFFFIILYLCTSNKYFSLSVSLFVFVKRPEFIEYFCSDHIHQRYMNTSNDILHAS